jgi:hypothetical protein
MKKILLSILCCVSLKAQPANNNHIATDTEIGSDQSLTQYLLHNYNRPDKVVGLSTVTLYIRASDGSQLLEFAGGPDFHWKRGFLNTYFGGTKDGRFVAAAFGEINLPDKISLTAASDPKFPFGNSQASRVWFRRVWLGRGHFFVRWEDLPVARLGIVTGKIGGEVRWHIKKKVEMYSYPHYDYQKEKGGITAGIRIKIL